MHRYAGPTNVGTNSTWVYASDLSSMFDPQWIDSDVEFSIWFEHVCSVSPDQSQMLPNPLQYFSYLLDHDALSISVEM
jgi:hypothetical protein